MSVQSFTIVDVFSERPYAGNQLAVFLDRGDLAPADMQNLAREMHFSETTFVKPEPDARGRYAVRIFTPAAEVPFAGHPTLGTAWVIANEIAASAGDTIVLDEKVGPIPVTFRDGVWWMRQNAPTFGEIVDPRVCAATLCLTPDDLDDRFPVQVVSTGLPFVMAPLKTLSAVRRARPDWTQFADAERSSVPRAILLFCPETCDPANTLHARAFVDAYGIVEDPATGSANGALAGYLVKHRYFDPAALDARVEQGYEISRPSLLFLKADQAQGEININVGGHVVCVAHGEFA